MFATTSKKGWPILNVSKYIFNARRALSATALLSLCMSFAACSGGNGGANAVLPDTGSANNPVRDTLSISSTGPKHVLTADYLQTLAEAQNCATYAPYVSYVYPKGDQFGTWHNHCGSVKTVAYTDFSMPNGTEIGVKYLTNALPGFAYSCAAAKSSSGAYVKTYSGTGYLFDPHGSCAAAYAQAVVDYHYNLLKSYNGGVAPDAMFADNYNDLYGESAVPSSFSGYADWTSKLNAAVGAVNMHGVQLFPNTLSIQSVSNQIAGLSPANVTGGQYESCISNARWADAENAQIAAVAKGKTFWCYSNDGWAYNNTSWSSTDGNAANAAIAAQRVFVYASFLLTYDLNKSIFETWFNTPSGFRVMPETGFVPTQPAYGVSSLSAIQFSGGTYARGYNACYYRGQLKGPCRIVVNPTTAVAPVTYASNFHHALVLHGSDILDGGYVSFDGAVKTSLAPNTAEILVP
jgi:hypothetical protein